MGYDYSSLLRLTCHKADGTKLELPLQRYSEQASVNGIPSFSFALSQYLDTVPTVETVRTGDIVIADFTATPDGINFKPYTTMVGFVREIGQRQAITEQGLTRVAHASGAHVSGWLMRDTLNYFVLSSAATALGLKAFLEADVVGVASLDVAMAALMERVAFEVLRIERPIDGAMRRLRDLLGYRFESIPGQGLYYQHWGNYEGSLWGLMDAYSDKPIHELYAAQLSPSDYTALEGLAWVPRAWGDEQSIASVVLRPAPFPHAKGPGEAVDFSHWKRLPLHDLTPGHMEATHDHSSDYSDEGVISAFFAQPSQFGNDEVKNRYLVPAVISVPKWKRYGLQVLTWQTQLWGQDAPQTQLEQFFREINWRIACQHNRMDEYAGATLNTRLAPWIRPGSRVRYKHYLGDNTAIYQGYVKAVQHDWSLQGGMSTLTVERALPEALYKDGNWFRWGLQELALPPQTPPQQLPPAPGGNEGDYEE